MSIHRVAKRISGSSIEPIKLAYGELPGLISQRALAEHYKLYLSYIDALNRVDRSIPICDVPDKHYPDHPLRVLKEAESFAIGGVLLHELYFENLTAAPTIPGHDSSFMHAVLKNWKSFEDFMRELRSTALLARGWAVVGACEIDPENDLRIFMLDSHNVGCTMGYSPVLIQDQFEHAFAQNFGIDRVSYVDASFKFLNWPEIEKRYNEVLVAARARTVI